jgi:hypothetical protein
LGFAGFASGLYAAGAAQRPTRACAYSTLSSTRDMKSCSGRAGFARPAMPIEDAAPAYQ